MNQAVPIFLGETRTYRAALLSPSSASVHQSCPTAVASAYSPRPTPVAQTRACSSVNELSTITSQSLFLALPRPNRPGTHTNTQIRGPQVRCSHPEYDAGANTLSMLHVRAGASRPHTECGTQEACEDIRATIGVICLLSY